MITLRAGRRVCAKKIVVTVFKQIDSEEKRAARPSLTKVMRHSSPLREVRFTAPELIPTDADGGNALCSAYEVPLIAAYEILFTRYYFVSLDFIAPAVD